MKLEGPRLDRLHRRLVVVLAMAGLIAFGAGAGFQPVTMTLAGGALVLAFFWQPTRRLAAKLERFWMPLAVILVVRAMFALSTGGVDVVLPVVDLLLLLLCAESLRAADAPNDVRLYALVFALFLASTAYRPGAAFGFAFLILVSFGSLALSMGLLRRKAAAYKKPTPPLDRSFISTSVALSGVTLVMSAAVFVTFPRIQRDWPGRGDILARSIAGFSDQVSIGQHGSSIYSNPEVVLRVEFPDGRPENPLGMHWRGRSYDRFDGIRWHRSQNIRPSLAPEEWYRDRWTGPLIEQRIYSAPLDTRVVFGLHPMVDIDPESRIQPLFDQLGDFYYWGAAEPVYSAFSMAGPPPPDSLRAARRGFNPDSNRFLQLPDLPDRITALADSITEGIDNRYDQVVAIRDYLRSFNYTRELPATAGQTSLDYFLFERREGHCEYFSTAMVMLLRTQGIHSRNVNGFLGGRWSEFGQYLAVTQNEAHSWVEVWFPNYGWVEFDPTPGGSAGDTTAANSWLWPGQFLFDGLQFRWSKWILDYSMAKQLDMFGRLSSFFGGEEPVADSTEETGPRWGWILLIGAVAILGLWRFFRSRTAGGPETLAYLSLLDAARRAGVVGREEITPMALISELERTRPAAAPPSRALVSRYLLTRFGGRPLTATDQAELRQALDSARRLMTSS